MAQFEKLQAPVIVSGFRPAVDPAPPWYTAAVAKKFKTERDDWLMHDGKDVTKVSGEAFLENYRHIK